MFVSEEKRQAGAGTTVVKQTGALGAVRPPCAICIAGSQVIAASRERRVDCNVRGKRVLVIRKN
jgi:hypothetical protein